MTTLENRPHTALLVVDVQSDVLRGTHARDAVVANVGSLVERARRERVPVVWVQQCDDHIVRGTDGWRIVPELEPGDAEPLVEKSYGDSFEDTALEAVLAGLGVGRLVVVGAQTDMCIRSTLHGAVVRGYDTTLVSDAHTTGGPDRLGRAAAGPGDRAHEPLLERPHGPGPHGRDGRDPRRGLHRTGVTRSKATGRRRRTRPRAGLRDGDRRRRRSVRPTARVRIRPS